MNLIYFKDNYKHKLVPSLEKPYKLNLCHTKKYINAKTRVLVVIEHVPSKDLKSGSLLGDRVTETTYSNLLKYTEQYASNFGSKVKPEYAFINYNDIKSYHLSKELQSIAHSMFRKRIDYWIEELQPTIIFVIGMRAVKQMFRSNPICDIHDIDFYRGWEFRYKDIPTYFTISIDDSFSVPEGKQELSDDAIVSANLLGYAGRKLAMAFIPAKEKNKITIRSDVDYKHITNLDEFKSFYKKLVKSKYIGYDIETTDLSTLDNTVLMTQFCLAEDPDVAHVIAIYHKDAKWSKKEIRYIEKKLKEFFSMKREYEGKNTIFLLGQNIGFDLRVTQYWLQIPFIYYCVWDTQAGEFLLDENHKGLTSHISGKKGYYGLDSICCNYGNDFYFKAEFGKADRVNIASTDLDDPLLRYGSADVIFLLRLYKVQCYLASKLPGLNGEKSYLHSYKRMCLVQQSQMIKVQSIMKARGTAVNHAYLELISSEGGPVDQKLDSLYKELYEDPSVIEANAVLMKEKNIPTGGLFGQTASRIIDVTKQAHKTILFDTVLQLEPLSYSKKTGAPTYDKFFLKHYKDTNSCTGLLQRINQLSKIQSSFIKPFIFKMDNDLDSRIDHRIRPNFGYLLVVTGRSNSSDPSLQQIPEHSDDASIVKEMFTIPRGHLHYEADYSAHEVRSIHLDSFVRTSIGNVQLRDIIDNEHARKINPNLPRVEILSYDTDTGKVSYMPILAYSRHKTDEEMYEIEYDGGSMRVTENHLVYTKNRGYIKAKDIKSDVLVIDLGQDITLKLTKGIKKIEKQEYVGDITVAKNHNIFISTKEDEDYALVHNCWGILSRDSNLGTTFKKIHNYLLKLRRKPTETLYKDRKKNADPHRLNYEMFTGTPASEVSDEQRQDSKGIVFGCFTGDTIVSTSYGSTRLDSIERTKTKVIDKYGKVEKAHGAVSKGLQSTLGVRTCNSFIQATKDHQMFVIDNSFRLVKKSLGHITNTDMLLSHVPKINSNLKLRLKDRVLKKGHCYALGLLVGTLTNETQGMICQHKSFNKMDLVCRMLHEVFGKRYRVTLNEQGYNEVHIENDFDSIFLINGVVRLPKEVFLCNQAELKRVVRGLYDATETSTKREIIFNFGSLQLSADISYIIQSFGVHCDLVKKALVISGVNVAKYFDAIGFRESVTYDTFDGDNIDNKALNNNISDDLYSSLYNIYCNQLDNPFNNTEGTLKLPTNPKDLARNIKDYKNSFYNLGLKDQYKLFKILTNDNSRIVYVKDSFEMSKVEVFDIINVSNSNSWLANGIAVSNSMYGMSANSLASTIKKELPETIDIMERFFAKFSHAKKWLTDKVNSAHRYLSIESPLGRRRNLFCLLSGHKSIISAGERRAQNCITGDHYIETDIGRYRIRDLVGKTFRVLVENGTYANCKGAESRGIKPIVSILLSNGTTLKGTPDHRVRIISYSGERGWKALGNLDSNDRVLKINRRKELESIWVHSKAVDAGTQEVFDIIDVERYHHFVANNIVVHNSEIQGFSSDLGFMASYLYSKAKYECYQKLDLIHLFNGLPVGVNCSIHDSLKCEDTFETFFLGIHLLEWAMTNGIRNYLKEVYGFKSDVCYEVEAAISGSSWAKKYTWIGAFDKPDYETGEEQDNCSLEVCVKQSLRDHEVLYPGTIKDVDKTYKKMIKSYKKQKEILNLDVRYPLNIKKEK